MKLTTTIITSGYSIDLAQILQKKIKGVIPIDITFWRALKLNSGRNHWVKIDDVLDITKGQLVDWQVGEFQVRFKDITIASFELYQMPHCCGILVSTAARVHNEYQKLGIGGLLNKLRQDIGQLLGYSLIFCTDCDKNPGQRKILLSNGWQDIYSFLNRRTGNKLNLSVKQIPENE